MKCVMCKHGDTHPGKVTVTLQRGDSTIIIKSVPGDVCENCGEYYLSEAVTKRALALAEEAVKKGAEVEILRYPARERGGPLPVASD
jgi:YgiT-type zinc finger domain-containing protein